MARRVIHLFNPLWNAAGGSEWETIELFRELSPHAEVTLWTDRTPDPALAAQYPIRQVDAERGEFPDGGTLVIVSVAHPKRWLRMARPRRVVILYNTLAPQLLLKLIHSLLKHNVKVVEIVYASEGLKERTKLPGVVQPSPIDLVRFRPREARENAPGRPFVIGRLSRDVPEKHHAEDLPLYAACARAGYRVRIMGGACLAERGAVPEGVELLPASAEPAEDFLRGLDCLVYRTMPAFWEVFGRVVFEAMACGLPVVCHQDGGYAASIVHGRNGFLFETTQEAADILRRLKGDRGLCERVGAEARRTVERMYSPEERGRVVEYYLR